MEYPAEISDAVKNFTKNLEKCKNGLKPLIENSRSDLIKETSALDSLKLDLTTAFAVNSMFWAYLASQGITPKNNPVKQELDRIKEYMGKVKAIEDRQKAPRLAKNAAKRFVSHAMYDLEDAQRRQKKQKTGSATDGGDVIVIDDEEEEDSGSQQATATNNSSDDAVIVIDDDDEVDGEEDGADAAGSSSKATSHNKKKKRKRRAGKPRKNREQ